MFKTGLVSISFRSLSAEEIIRNVSKVNLEFVEWGSDIHAPFDNNESVLSIKRLSEEYGVKTSSYGTYFRIGKDKPEDIIQYFKAAKTLGTNVLRIWIGSRGSADYTSEEKKQLYNNCITAAHLAEKEGIVLCCECHPKTLTDTVDSTMELMQGVGCDNFRMYWQPNQFMSVEDNLLFAKKTAPFTVNIHVFNWKEKEKYPLSEGIQTWKKYLEYFDGSQKLLLEFMPDDRIESLSSETEALQKILM